MSEEYYKARIALAAKMAKRTGILKKDCVRLIDAMIDEMADSIKRGDGMHLSKLGRFVYRVRQATKRRDPYTGEYIPVPPVTRVKFVPCKDVKYGTVQIPWEDHLSETQRASAWYKTYIEENSEENSEK